MYSKNATAILTSYHRSIGGAPEAPAKGKGMGKRAASTSNVNSPASGKKRSRKSDTNGTTDKGELPLGLWEDLCTVAAIIEEQDMPNASSTKKKKDDKNLLGMIQWHDGRKTQHAMSSLRQKCPQRVLDYYESHLSVLSC